MEFIIDNEVIKGHDKYLLIMNLISNPSVDVSTNQDFQRAYSGYYFPAQVKQSFKDFYFKYMQECRSSHPSFGEVLQHIYTHTGYVHYSFASKLLHTLDPDSPVLDRHVLRVLGFQRMDGQYIKADDPAFQRKKDADASKRIAYYCSVFDAVVSEYSKYENEPFMQKAIARFDALSPVYKIVPYTKKVDMLLFRLRNERGVSVLDYLYELQ